MLASEWNGRKVCFTSDIYKVDDRERLRLPNPHALNVEWIASLFGPVFAEITGAAAETLLADDYPAPTARLAAYRRLGIEFSTDGWARLHAGIEDDWLAERLGDLFAGSLVVGFETPPYLARILHARGIPLIDLTIHPVRFMPDYVFGMRSNLPDLHARLGAFALAEETIRDEARLSRARSIRAFRRGWPEAGAAVFFGQISIDSSLIVDGRMAGLADVTQALAELRDTYPHVYYRPHPHIERRRAVEAAIAEVGGITWTDASAYDLLAVPTVAAVASLSSSVLHEAPYFGVPARRVLANRDPALDSDAESGLPPYLPMHPDILGIAAWRHVLGAAATPAPGGRRLADGALRTSINMTWGR